MSGVLLTPERTAYRLAAVAALTAGVAWLGDYFVLPNLWDQLSQPQNLGSLFNRLDAVCLAVEFLALAVVAISVHRELRPPTLLTRGALACAALAAVAAATSALLMIVTGESTGHGIQAIIISLAGLWLVVVSARALTHRSYSRAAAWTGILVGGLWLAAVAEYLFFPTGVAYAVQKWMFLIWAGLFAAARLGPAPGSRWAVAPWIATALVPLGWLLGLFPLALVGWFEGEAGRSAGAGGWLLLEALWVTAPTIAVISSVRAVRAGRRSGRIAVVATGLLLLVTLGWFALAAVNGFAATRITVLVMGIVVLAAVGFFGWLLPRTIATDGTRPDAGAVSTTAEAAKAPASADSPPNSIHDKVMLP